MVMMKMAKLMVTQMMPRVGDESEESQPTQTGRASNHHHRRFFNQTINGDHGDEEDVDDDNNDEDKEDDNKDDGGNNEKSLPSPKTLLRSNHQ